MTKWIYSFDKKLENIVSDRKLVGNKGLKKISMLGEENRYYPLMRGFVDGPTPGDPVLLCTVGGVNYYFGQLNSINNNALIQNNNRSHHWSKYND